MLLMRPTPNVSQSDFPQHVNSCVGRHLMITFLCWRGSRLPVSVLNSHAQHIVIAIGRPDSMPTTKTRPEPTSLPCYAVRVRSRGEQFVADLLRHKDFQVLVPTFTEGRPYSDRVSRVTSALFPGYVFVRVGSQDLMRLLSTDGVSYVLRNGEAGGSLSDQETLAVEALCKGS